MITALDTAAGALALFLGYGIYKRRKQSCPFPPGPKGLPILGNSLQIPAKYPWKKYMEWSKQFDSDIIHLTAPGNHIVVLNSLEAAIDLFGKKSTVYSDRPYLPMVCDLVGLSRWNLGLMPYGSDWRNARKMFNQYLGLQESRLQRPKMVEYTHKLLRRLLSEPDRFLEHVRTGPGEFILDVAYGIKVAEPKNDSWLELAEAANEAARTASAPGHFLVDLLPFCAGFQRIARELRQLNEDMYSLPFEDVKRRINYPHRRAKTLEGSAPESITQAMLAGLDVTNIPDYEDYLMKCVTGVMYSAASDTERAQEEIDSVVHGERVPGIEDMLSLPYTTALVKEVMRWYPPTPQAVVRRNTEDDIHRGYIIPKGSIIIPNVWAMSRDCKAYPGDPGVFRPSRFLDASGQMDSSVLDPAEFIFGFGRRICPGRYLAYDSMWTMMASILATFKISKCKGEEPLELYTTGHIIPDRVNMNN
ncbi:cytochrome P450 [Punctularia strigosozonata HHB-11173 SS5]|uniref:cytochrome P450 n=1 Tax=Punctularia strigosozonata (strain HHB-11173) TaxID=741275 RepID=UPI0004416EB6|nr:cytochrome P450 [Punctularia strigosozonata HHB-11173 SS5]EIN06162.1 cytochrome P450 [Punctularia strigosozonata HHB-11173 SS5]